jgi:hypothetical protein
VTQPTPRVATSTVTLTLLTQADCGLCEQAKTVLIKLTSDPVPGVTVTIEQIDLRSTEGHSLGEQAGVLFAPGVLLDGVAFSHGRLSERKLRKALSALPTLFAQSATASRNRDGEL